MPAAEAKLTKKQKKALAFRSRIKKTDVTTSEAQAETLPSPALEGKGQSDDERLALEVGRMEEESPSDGGSDGKGKGRVDGKVESAKAQKRKRETSDDDSQSIKEQKKMKKEESQGRKERLILFVGNLKYTTTVEGIREHFSSCNPLPDVRLLTPKASAGKQTTKSKGCAFLEFTNQKSLQQALKLHQSKLDGRTINVELTAGGGGKGEARMMKLQERNKHLYSQSKKKTGGGESHTASLDPSQRYSSTSGVGQAPRQKRTWSVGDSIDTKKSKRRRPMKSMGTGVNAIPVG